MTHKLIFFLFLAVALDCSHCSINEQYTFEQYVVQFNKMYTCSSEMEFRRGVWQHNYADILQKERQSDGTYHLRVNNFTDWTKQELSEYDSYRPSDDDEADQQTDGLPFLVGSGTGNPLGSSSSDQIQIPEQLDYRQLGKVTRVKSQKSCGSCWTFCSTAAYESALLIQTNVTYDLAEEFGLECTPGSSCVGGWPEHAMNKFREGIPLEEKYAYTNGMETYPGICEEKDKVKAPWKLDKVQSYRHVSDEQLKRLLVEHGPLSVVVRAEFQFHAYSQGVFKLCDPDSKAFPNHAVLLVGYTAEGHWIIKNSWGEIWGDNGYMTIHKDYNCRINRWVDVLQFQKPQSPQPDSNTQEENENDENGGETEENDIQPEQENNGTSQILNYTIEMMDTHGDGWHGLTIGVSQQGNITAIFGNQFTEGFIYPMESIQIKNNVPAELVVVNWAAWTEQARFVLKDQSGNIVFTKNPEFINSNKKILYRWCPGDNCQSPHYQSIKIYLRDSFGDGWSQNILAISQGSRTECDFGENFLNGRQYGPINCQINEEQEASIVVGRLGSWRKEIGFTIYDQNNSLIFERKFGENFYADDILGKFCLRCSEEEQVENNALSPSSSAVNQGEQTGTEVVQDVQDKKQSQDSSILQGNEEARYFGLNLMLGLLASIFAVSTIFLFFRLKKIRGKLSQYLAEKEERENNYGVETGLQLPHNNSNGV